MEYSQNTMAAAADLERRFGAFESALGARLKEAARAETAQATGGRLEYKWGAQERCAAFRVNPTRGLTRVNPGLTRVNPRLKHSFYNH